MTQNFDNQEYLVEKWEPVLSDERYPDIPEDKKGVVAQIFENQQKWNQTELKPRMQNLFESGEVPFSVSSQVGGTFADIDGNNPQNQLPNMIMSILRRAVPRLISMDVAATVPLSQPNGYIFTLRSMTDNLDETKSDAAERAKEILIPGQYDYNISGPKLSDATLSETQISTGATEVADKYSTSEAELLGTKNWSDYESALTGISSDRRLFHNIRFEMDRFPVEVKTRSLGASFSVESVQDFAATFNGLDVESELVRIMSDQISTDMNQETLRIIRRMAKPAYGTMNNTNVGDNTYYVLNSNIAAADDRIVYGRWVEEKIRTMMLQIDNQSVQIARETGRGLANLIITTPAVVAMLRSAGLITVAPGMATATSGLVVDQSYAGVLAGQYQVYVDYYFGNTAQALPKTGGGTVAVKDYIVIGYQGGPTDSGLFFCPYTLLNLYKAVDPYTFQNRMAFKSRYAMAQNAFDLGTQATPDATNIAVHSSRYYRKFYVTDLPPF